MTVEYVDLVDSDAIAAELTGLDVETIMRMPPLELADSALHAPQAGFGETEFFPDCVDKASVLVVHRAKNHPLPDGNKRAAWVSLRLFVELNGWTWDPRPSVDDAERAVVAIASGEWAQEQMAAWLRAHLVPARRLIAIGVNVVGGAPSHRSAGCGARRHHARAALTRGVGDECHSSSEATASGCGVMRRAAGPMVRWA